MEILIYIYYMVASKSHNSIIPLQVYPHNIMLSINETDDQLKKALKKGKVKKGTDLTEVLNLPEDNLGRCTLLTSKFIVIRLKTTDNLHANIRLAIHECFHAVCFNLDFIGVKFEMGTSDEQYAYLLDYLSGKVIEILTLLHNSK